MEGKVRAIQQAPEPRNVSGGHQLFRQILPNLSITLAPLYVLCSATRWRWTATERQAFQAAKELLMSYRLLVHFNPSQDLILA